jgi:hypothetical protein
MKNVAAANQVPADTGSLYVRELGQAADGIIASTTDRSGSGGAANRGVPAVRALFQPDPLTRWTLGCCASRWLVTSDGSGPKALGSQHQAVSVPAWKEFRGCRLVAVSGDPRRVRSPQVGTGPVSHNSPATQTAHPRRSRAPPVFHSRGGGESPPPWRPNISSICSEALSPGAMGGRTARSVCWKTVGGSGDPARRTCGKSPNTQSPPSEPATAGHLTPVIERAVDVVQDGQSHSL